MFRLIVIIFILTINYTHQYKLDCRNSMKDLHYKGHINITRNGHVCKYWKHAKRYQTEDENYCRTPSGDGDNGGGPWCYTSRGGKTWDRCNIPICGGKSCPNLTNHLIPKDGKRAYHFGETVIVSCQTGYHMKGDRIIACEQLGQWNATMPTCEEITCTRMSLNLTEDMHVNKYVQHYNFNETVTMSCISGFIGTTVTPQCRDVNKWSHKPPMCTRIACTRGSLNLNEHIHVMTDAQSYDFQVYVTMSCKRGFTGPSVSSQCIDVDKWSQASPMCKEITCTKASLHLSQNVNVTNDKQSYTFQEEVTMSCNNGFSGRTVTAGCTDVNTWSENTPTCTVASCPKLNLTPHLSQPRKLEGYHHKDEIHFGCDVGYYLVGSLVLSCLVNGKWSSQQPTCKAASCPALPKLPQLQHMPDLREYIYNDTVTFQCDVGFLVSGPVLITCTTNNRQSPVYWNGKQPYCTAVACPGLYEGYSIKWSPNRTTYSYNDIVHFQCDDGYQLSGPSSLVCQADVHESIGHWSNKQPACVEEYKGVSYMVLGVLVALIIVTVGINIGLMCFIRIRLKDSSKQYEDIKINMDQHRNHNEDQIYSELSDTQQ